MLLTHNAFQISYHPIVLPHFPKGLCPKEQPFRIVQLSDLHFYEHTNPHYYDQVAAAVMTLKPNLIAVTGDIIHYGNRHVAMAGEFLSRLNAPYGQFAVLGNHDYADGARSRNIRAMLSESGFHVLINDRVCVHNGTDLLWVAGLDDYKYGQPDLKATLRDIPNDSDAPVILLAHNPLHFDTITANPETPVDIILSGHTHAGHVYLPFLGPVYRYVLGMKYRYGFYRKGGTHLYVTSGLGSAAFYINLFGYKRGFPRFRFNTYPEIAVFEFSPVQTAAQEALPDMDTISASWVSFRPRPEKIK